MIRKIVSLSATAFVATAIAFAPLAASAITSAPANVPVEADVAPTATVADVTPAITTTWDGTAAQAVPFDLLVNTNAPGGYVFTFTSTNNAGAFQLIGSGGNATIVPYSVTGTGADGTTYNSGLPGAHLYGGPTAPGGDTSTFDVGLPIQGAVPADSYIDTLVVTVTTQDLT